MVRDTYVGPAFVAPTTQGDTLTNENIKIRSCHTCYSGNGNSDRESWGMGGVLLYDGEEGPF